MLRRTAQLSVALALLICPVLLSAQAAQPTLYVYCAAQAPPQAPGTPATVYFSGIMQTTAANLQNVRTGFAQFLMQRYAYRGAAACGPRNSMANAQTALNNESTAFRNAKRNVVETGWSAGGGALGAVTNPLSSILGGGQAAPAQTAATTAQPAAAPKAQVTGGQAPAGGSSGGNGGGGNPVANVFGQIFGTNNSGGATGAAGAKPAAGQPANAKAGAGGAGAGGANQSPFSEVSGTLSSVFGNKGNANGGGANGGRGGQPGQPSPGNGVIAGNGGPGQPGAPGARNAPGSAPGTAVDGVLGSAQFGTTKLDIFGCGRQDMQVACVAELTNQNPKDTLVKGTDVWKDAFLVDDRGDRHVRTNAFFLNIDGEQRPQLDISNGKTAKFVLMFDNVPAKVQKVTLRSQNGNMDVEEIGLIAADASSSGTATASAPPSPNAQH